MSNLAVMPIVAARKPAQALPLFEESFKGCKVKLPMDHPQLLLSMNNLAMAYVDAGRTDEALPLLEDVLKLRKSEAGRRPSRYAHRDEQPGPRLPQGRQIGPGPAAL